MVMMSNVKSLQANQALLEKVLPVSECSPDDLIVLSDHAWVDEVGQGQVLAQLGSSDGWDYYLMEGTLKLVAGDGKVLMVTGGTPAARNPIARLQPRQYTIQAMTAVRYLRINASLAQNLRENVGVSVDESSMVSKIHSNSLYSAICDDLLKDRLVIPAFPEVAHKARHLIEDSEVSIVNLAKVVGADPALSAKLIKSANGVLYHGQPSVDSCARAISRLGLSTTKQLIMAFLMRNLFEEKFRDPQLVQRAKALWSHSVEVAAISMALAHVTSGLDADEALLGGLVHDIGELVILTYADNYPEYAEHPEKLQAIIEELKGEIGAIVLKYWRFPEALVTAARYAEDWSRNGHEKPDYCDVVILAQLHNMVGSPTAQGYPAPFEVPAFRKVADGKMTPEISRLVLDEAKERIAETRQLLTSR